MDAVKIWGDKMTKDEARKALLETLEEYCHDKGYNLQVFAGMANWVYTLYPEKKTMTNREWLIWKMIDMSDEEFAQKLNGLGWFCDICASEECNDAKDCQKIFIEWLRHEHEVK